MMTYPWRLIRLSEIMNLKESITMSRNATCLNKGIHFKMVDVVKCIFIVILGIDLEHQLILNRIVYPAAIVALILDISLPQTALIASAPDAFLSLPAVAARTVVGVTGGVTGFGLLLIPALIFQGGMGWGDVKMAGLIGLVVGFPVVIVSVLLAIVVGGIVGGVLLLLKIRGRKDAIPFGPFLSLAAIATLLFGNDILNWYLGLFA